MDESPRRLAAIVFTDIVGYTALAQRDEALAIRLLDSHNSLVRSVLGQYPGREVKTIGDAFLLEFESALEAVLFAVDVQTKLRDHNSSAHQEERVLVRIGVHLGDVIHRGSDVLGDAVNIASRIVGQSEPCGICMSGQVYEQVRNKVRYQIERMPAQALKNVEVEIDLFRVVLPWERATEAPLPADNRIAVLPFANISHDPADAYFADGLTEELISALSDVRGLRVIARTSVNGYRDASKGAKQIGSELRVSHLLEGSVRKAGDRVRVAAHLVEVASQSDVWSATYDKDMGDVFSIQSNIAASVVGSLKVKLLSAEKSRIEKKDTDNVEAYVAYLKGRSLLRQGTVEAARAARVQFEKAIQSDAGYAKAYSGMADTHMMLGDLLFATAVEAFEEATSCVRKALELDPNLAEARASLGNLMMYDARFAEAEKEFTRAIESNPSYATGHQWYSSCLLIFGRFEEALKEVLLAEELDPLSPSIAISVIYRLLFLRKDHEVEKRIRKLEEIDPSSPLVEEARMVYSFTKQDWETTTLYLDKMIERDHDDPYLTMDRAYICAVTGKRDEALRLVETLKGVREDARIKGQLLAFVYVGLGDLDSAFRWLNFALSQKEFFIHWVRGYTLFEPVRRDPRFREFLTQANLPVD